MGERIGNRGAGRDRGGDVCPVDLPDERFQLGDQGIELGHKFDRIFRRLFPLLDDATQRQSFPQTLDALLRVGSQHESFAYPHPANLPAKSELKALLSTISLTANLSGCGDAPDLIAWSRLTPQPFLHYL